MTYHKINRSFEPLVSENVDKYIYLYLYICSVFNCIPCTTLQLFLLHNLLNTAEFLFKGFAEPLNLFELSEDEGNYEKCSFRVTLRSVLSSICCACYEIPWQLKVHA